MEGWSRGLLRSQAQMTSARPSPVFLPLTGAFDFVPPVTVSVNISGKSLLPGPGQWAELGRFPDAWRGTADPTPLGPGAAGEPGVAGSLQEWT